MREPHICGSVKLLGCALVLVAQASAGFAQDPNEAGRAEEEGAPAGAHASDEDRSERWRADLEFLAAQLEARHPNLYHTLPRERFRAGLQELEARVPSASDREIILGLTRLLVRLGDGHTLVPLLWDRSLGYGRLPVELVRTADGVSVLAADASTPDLPGARVVRIGSLEAEAALDSLATLVARDNEWTDHTRAAEYAVVPEILHGLGITGSDERVRLTVRDRTGARREIVLDAIARDARVEWDYGSYTGSPPWLDRRDDPYWLTVLPGDSVVYVQYNRADRDKEEESVAEFGRRLLETVTAGSARRIVLDLRWNRGGSRWRARHLLSALIAAEHEWGVARSSRSRRPTGHLVTLIGPNTFSAATQFALDLELHTNTAFLGLPTGGRPNGYGEVGRFRLPGSGLEIRHSIFYHQANHARDTRPAIFPDRRIEWTAEDVVAGRDPVLEAALRWEPAPSGVAELERRIDEHGVEAALAWLDSLERNPPAPLRVTEADLNRLGYGLLREDRPEVAAVVFRYNLERHPWSANTYDSLADAYLRLEREPEAERLICRAFAIDRQFTRALDRGVDCGSMQAATEAIDTLALESHARFLADDLLEGRGPASRGERLAALYLITRMRALGLQPLPSHDFRLPVPLTAVHVDEEAAAIRLTDRNGNGANSTRTLHPPAFYHPGGARSAFRDFGGELLLAGATPNAHTALEEYEDLSGRVVVLTPPWSGLHELAAHIRRRGAAGYIGLIPNEFFYGRLRVVRGPTRYFLPDGIDDPANQSPLPNLVGGPEMIRALGLEEEARPGRELERARPLDTRMQLELPHRLEEKTGYNVAGYIPGADPELRDEWVVYIAHYDHVGYGEPTDGDSIWNGFIDNAAGSAMLLEIARVLAADPPPRSVAFLFVTAEEQGLLGSNWFVHRPPIALERIHAAFNLDGGAPPAPPTTWGIVGADQTEAGAVARRVVEGRGWGVNAVAHGPQSDHWPFHRAGVNTVMLFPGSELEGLTEEEAEALTERWLQPHTPGDEWDPDFPFSGLRRYADLALEIGRALAHE